MSERELRRYADIWTNTGKYGLVELVPENDGGCVIFDLEAWAPVLIEEGPELYKEIVRRLRDAGARRLTRDEARPK